MSKGEKSKPRKFPCQPGILLVSSQKTILMFNEPMYIRVPVRSCSCYLFFKVFTSQCIAQSQKIGNYNPFSIPALKSNLNPSFKTLVNLNLCLKMGSTIQSRSLFWKKNLHYKRTFCTFSPTVADKKNKMYIQKRYGKTNLTFDCFDKVLFYEFH